MKYDYKIPDYSGGFLYKKVWNNQIVTYDNRGNYLDVEPCNFLEKGRKCDYGIIKSIETDKTVLINESGETITISSDLLNRYLASRSQRRSGILSSNLREEEIDTPIGIVKYKSSDPTLRKSLTKPESITMVNSSIVFDDGRRNIIIKRTSDGFGFLTEILNKKSDEKIYKAFRDNFKIGQGWNKKGGIKPNHKYIERKPNPKNPDEYIYLYELPSGKREWRDGDGKAIREEAGTESKAYLDLDIGQKVMYQGKTGTVLETSENYIALAIDNKKKLINKKEHLERLKKHANLKIGDPIELEGGEGVVKQLSDKIVLVELPDRSWKWMRKEEYLMPVPQESDIQKEPEEKTFTDEPEWYSSKEYQAFAESSKKRGFGRVDDTRYVKYVQQGAMRRKVEREFNPETSGIEVVIDGTRDYKLGYKDGIYDVLDIRDDGYVLRDDETNEKFFLDSDLYENYLKEQENKAEVLYRDRWGEIIGDKEKQVIKISGEVSDETRERVEKLRGARTSRFRTPARTKREIEAEESRKREIVEQQEKAKERLRNDLNTQEYLKYKSGMKRKGFEATENPFIFKKNVSVEGLNFEFKNIYDRETRDNKSQLIKGKYEKVQVGGGSYDLHDIIESDGVKFVEYVKDGEIEAISVSALKDVNGSLIFEPEVESKGVQSKRNPDIVYFDAGGLSEIATFEVVEYSDLIASNNLDGSANEKYTIPGAQNRDRSSKADREQVSKMSIALKKKETFPFWSDISKTAEHGAPIVNHDYQVIAGNGRALGVGLHYEQKNPEYKKYLMEEAKRLGFDESDIEKMRMPVLVRRVKVDEKDRVNKLGIASNTPMMQSKTRTEDATGKATIMSDETFQKITDLFVSTSKEFGEGATINEYLDRVGGDVVQAMIGDGVIGQNESKKYYDFENKNMSADQKNELHKIIVHKFLGENGKHLDYTSHAVQAGLVAGIGELMSLRGGEGDISSYISEALPLLRKWNSEQSKDKYGSDIETFVDENETTMYEGTKLSDKAKLIFKKFGDRGQTIKGIRNMIFAYKDKMEDSLFAPGMSPEDAFNEIFN